ncbi:MULTISPECIES: lipopolysaccharide assembly protein LapB [Asticcacaulis]|uniref:tetratricopeptide repeat protein n=1 Tax=Asticcacaulis TaxID=76890 RepID=UPI001AE57915|nr:MULTISPECIES: hypothetical protein [Asticcacaulis]MBP2161595.1 tetratricopeptide (TPR) repeat protein [Asticcacaulis solisilvae]MDR6802640.1 tetratricopeptide (TPR) repeat protein [Asticcacaulis sp. BE141]
MEALDYFMEGRFSEAIDAFRCKLTNEPDDIAWVDGLAKSYCEVGDFVAALPFLEHVHNYQKAKNPDSPGQQLQLSCAYWCLDDRARAIALTRELCASILDRSINMAPDQAGGATFGLILHYMSATTGDVDNYEYALDYLRKLNIKYDKRPTQFRYPVLTVKQVLGEVSFEDVLEGVTNERTLAAALRATVTSRLVKSELGIALFHDGTLQRITDNEIGCRKRMSQVFELGYQTESIRWYLARNEIAKFK